MRTVTVWLLQLAKLTATTSACRYYIKIAIEYEAEL